MDDLRQKLFPIFLQEAERNLLALRQYLGYESLSVSSAEELETAFRAAHTLKGTANLVQAESICKIARRLEAMLEKHFEARTRPTQVEHEALKLAVDWLAPLVSALQGDLQEPKLFVSEALQALDLAEAFPGRTPLIELLDSHSEQRSPQLDDPFAGDPELLDEAALVEEKRDPFAEDPGFGLEIDLVSSTPAATAVGVDDPFADDDDFSAADELNAVVEPELNDDDVEPDSAPAAEELPYDPFAEDSLELEVDAEQSAPVTVVEPEQSTADPVRVEEAVAPAFEAVDEEAAEIVSAETIEDPFAEDEDFVEPVDPDSAVAETAAEDLFSTSTESVAERAEEIAESLLLPDEEAVPRRDYVCCVFSIGGRDYHLPIKQMKEITDLPQLLPLPLAPPMVSGLVNLRGEVMPVINLAILNQHQQSEVRVQRRLVVAEHKNESLAFLVDGVPYLAEDFSGEKIDMSKFLSRYQIRGVE